MQVVWQARIMMNPTHLLHNEIESSKLLQYWLGISYTIKDSEGIVTVQEAIKREFDVGLPSLITSEPLHNILYNEIMEKSMEFQKEWFLLVRSTREYHEEHQINNEFNQPGALRDWLGLDR